MKFDILNDSLMDYLSDYDKTNFAKIAKICNANQFYISQYSSLDEIIHFNESLFLERYRVLHILGNSLVVYEYEDDKIITWICYTEEDKRKIGYMSILLEKLNSLHPDKKIIIDTYNKKLRKICNSLNIELLRKD